MTKIIVIRHCETIGNVKGEMQGYHEDTEFTEKGTHQMQNLIQRLKKEKISAVFCSDLGRAYKTAETIAADHNLIPIKIKELREGDIGDWRVLPVKEGIDKWMIYYEEEKKKGIKREDIRPPNGENSFDHQKRVMGAVNDILSQYKQGTVVIVGHGGTNKVIIGSLVKKDPDEFYTIGQSNACVNILEINGGISEIICIDDTSHLENGANKLS